MCHRSFERSREAHGLATLGQHGNDPANRGKKSHIQHAIGLVENQHLKRLKMNQPAFEEVFQAAGRGDHQAGSLAQGSQLLSLGQSPHDQGCGGKFCSSQCVVLIHNLHGKFAGGDKHERRESGRAALKKPVDDWDQESQCLAGSSACGMVAA